MLAILLRNKWLKYALSAVILCTLLPAFNIITVTGESTGPRFVMMRLEDIGPGGQYDSIEKLGKLRAVLDYLHDQHAAYHLAVVPRWINLSADGSRYDVSLDQTGNPYVEAYQNLLKQAVRDGATLGMHGYTHQVGNVRRDDGQHESGIGNEFNNPGSNETMSAAYGEQRLKEGLAILTKAGLKPRFWEAPHYRSTPEQDHVFRNYFGLNYQSDVQANLNSPVAQYINKRNDGYGETSLGAAYVPTPFDYIPFNKDEKIIIDRVGKSSDVASFFFHPFLEFKHLVPVLNEAGEPVERDGLPEFRYQEPDKSLLHRLISGLKAKNYAFYSIQDYVPFTPAHSVKLKQAALQEKPMIGDVTGDGQSDLVTWDTKKAIITVKAGSFNGPRNEPQGPETVWARAAYTNGAAAALGSTSYDGGSNLWMLYPEGRLERLASDGQSFTVKNSWKTEPRSCSSLYVLPQTGGEVVIAGLSTDRLQMFGYLINKGEAKPLKPFKFKNEMKNGLQLRALANGSSSLISTRLGAVSGLEISPDRTAMEWKQKKTELNIPSEDGELRFGDFNGDGKEDIIRWNTETMRYTVYLGAEEGEYRLLSTFGPWGKPGSKLMLADLDGNGKKDLALINREEGYLDTALSFESR
jgi:predicted deacetylase